MINRELNRPTMARVAYRKLPDQRPRWEALAPVAVPDFTLPNQQLATARTLLTQRSQQGPKGYTAARNRAEYEAAEAAGYLVGGLRAALLDHPRPMVSQSAMHTSPCFTPLLSMMRQGCCLALSRTSLIYSNYNNSSSS